jgi:hypothetical protein
MVWSCGSPARLVRCRKAAAIKPLASMSWVPPASPPDVAGLGGQVVENALDGPVVGNRDGVTDPVPKAHRNEALLGAENVRS